MCFSHDLIWENRLIILLTLLEWTVGASWNIYNIKFCILKCWWTFSVLSWWCLPSSSGPSKWSFSSCFPSWNSVSVYCSPFQPHAYLVVVPKCPYSNNIGWHANPEFPRYIILYCNLLTLAFEAPDTLLRTVACNMCLWREDKFKRITQQFFYKL